MQISIKTAREARGLKQREIAEKMNVSISAVSAWETNKWDMSARQFSRFCEIVGMKRDDIFLPDIFR